jgi:DNA-binding transcriptional regulator YdaS (Cro superfamily)
MKRFSVICLQCGLSVHRRIDAETAQTEIHPVTYQQKCKIASDAADFDCPELERAVERSRRWDPIFQSGMSRPASSDDIVVFPEALSQGAVKNQKLVAEKAELSTEAADLRARVGVMDMVNAAPATPGDLTPDELRRALDIAASKALERL